MIRKDEAGLFNGHQSVFFMIIIIKILFGH